MNLVMTQYIEVNLIGIAILVIMLFYSIYKHRYLGQNGQKFFAGMLICNMIILLSDIMIYLMRGRSSAVLLSVNHVVCILYFAMHAYFGYLWFRYSMEKLYPEYRPAKALRALLLVPCLLSIALAVASPWTKWVYHLTSGNMYMRGPHLGTMSILAYLYWIASAVFVIKEMISPQRIREKSEYITLLVFPIPTLIGNMLQFQNYGISVVWVCAAISLLILFINLQNDQLSRDILTGLFNRRQTSLQIAWELKRLADDDCFLLVMMIDVDHFKQINDRFGHVAGDMALIEVAGILKKSCHEKDFIGRFGGDEFIVVGHVKERQEAELLVRHIDKITGESNQDRPDGYQLSFSIGYQLVGRRDHLSADALIFAADNNMYRIKNQKAGK